MQALTITPKQMFKEIVEVTNVGLVPYFQSSPGVGKSSIAAKVAKAGKLKLIDIRLSQCTPEDLQGYPMRNGNKATFTPFDIFPLEGEPLPEGYGGWMILFDELSSANKMVQAAAYKVILDKYVGSFKLHEKVVIVCAGNKSTDKAVTTQMSTALQSRLIHFELAVSVSDFTEYAVEAKLDHRVIAFVNYLPTKLMDFRPDHNDKTFPCPRTWEFVSKLVKGRNITPDFSPRLCGSIGQGTAVEFMTFAQEFERLPKLVDIVANPKEVDIPPESSTKYATISMLIENHTTSNIAKLLQYVSRFPLELQIVFTRGVNAHSPRIRGDSKEFAAYLYKMLEHLK